MNLPYPTNFIHLIQLKVNSQLSWGTVAMFSPGNSPSSAVGVSGPRSLPTEIGTDMQQSLAL